MKEEALLIASRLDTVRVLNDSKAQESVLRQAQDWIRRLVEELDKQELNDGGFSVKNATYWKRQYNLMSAQNDRLKSGIYHANEQIKYLESLAPQTKPFSDDEINEIAMYCSDMNEYGHSKLDEFAFARAIEERHGIK